MTIVPGTHYSPGGRSLLRYHGLAVSTTTIGVLFVSFLVFTLEIGFKLLAISRLSKCSGNGKHAYFYCLAHTAVQVFKMNLFKGVSGIIKSGKYCRLEF